MVKTRYITFIIVAAALAAFAACTRTPDMDAPAPEPDPEAGPASLTIDFSTAAPDMATGTRAEGEPQPTVTGLKINCLTVLLIHKKDNKIVAVRTIEKDAKAVGTEHGDNGFIEGYAVDKDGNVVDKGTVNSELESSDRVRVTFNYDNPLHKDEDPTSPTYGQSVEKLLRGEYRLFVIANYKHSVPTSSSGAAQAGYETVSLQKTLEGIIDDFHNHAGEGLGNFKLGYESFYNLRFLMNRAIKTVDGKETVVAMTDAAGNTLTPFIRPAVSQTLSATQNVFLTTGENKLSVELLRISSRTSVEVNNLSTTHNLKVHSLKFSDNYTQAANYLFKREYAGGNDKELENAFLVNDNKIINKDGTTGTSFIGAPDVTFSGVPDDDDGPAEGPASGAIVPFDPSDNEGSNSIVKPGRMNTIFDALMYESYDTKNPFTYTIDVSYLGVDNYRTTDPDKIAPNFNLPADATAVDLYNKIENDYGSNYFLIRNVGTKKYLYENNRQILAGGTQLDLTTDIKSYLWTMELTLDGETPRIALKNAKSQRYMSTISNGTEGMSSANLSTENILGFFKNYVTFANDSGYYLNVWGGGTNLGGYNTKDDKNNFYLLYPMSGLTNPSYVGTPRIKKTIPLTVYNDATGIVEELHEIQRNDFIKIRIDVSYNPDSGDFEFEVKNWNKGGGNVTFN